MTRQNAIQTQQQTSSASPLSRGGILQRKCEGCGQHTIAGGECGDCGKKKIGLQRKLTIGASNDPLELEADRVADRVMSASPNSVVNSAPPSIQRFTGQTAGQADMVAPASVDSVLSSPGSPLESGLQQDMGQRFGHDFSRVRVHTDAAAARSAKDVNANAYTVGHNVIFSAGKFSPKTYAGRSLLAHELTHVVQQSENHRIGVVQRAEVDDRSCAGLPDIAPDIDSKVNSAISAARAAAPTPLIVADFLKDVAGRVGGKFVGSIEKLIQGMSTGKRTNPAQNLSNTKFAGVENVNQFYSLHTLGLAKVVGPAANVKSICTGADKFGHFFEEGFLYFRIAQAGGTSATLDSFGNFLEISPIQGLGVTGVFSNADKAANLAGKQFYKDLEADPTKFKFNIGNYITKDWNETANPSFYASSEGSIIWSNLLTGSWDGKFTSAGGTSSPIDAKVDLNATAGSVTGTNKWPAGAAKPNQEIIKNGKITQRTTSFTGTKPSSPPETLSATPVKGVTIDFDWELGWELGSSSGKGRWESVDEQNLIGTWGIGSSRDNGGTWQLKKV